MKTNKELKAIAKQICIQPRVEMVQETDSVDVYLYGSIVEEQPVDWWTGEPEEGEFIYPQKVRNLFEDIDDDKTVNIHLNSPGGDVYASVSIGNFIKQRKNKVNIYIDAIAASGASIIAMAGDSIHMYQNSMMMIHRASAIAYGNTTELEKVSQDLKKFDEVVLNSYVDRYKGSEEELQALIEDETYFTAQECIAIGLADEIVTPKTKENTKVTNSAKTDVKVSILQKFVAKEPLKASTKQNLLTKFKGE